MNRWRTSLVIFKQAVLVLDENRKLLWFPILGLGVLAVIVAFFILALSSESGTVMSDVVEMLESTSSRLQEGGLRERLGFLALMLPFYVGATFMATFLNVAFYNEILNALRGKPVSVLGGLGYAVTRSGAILMWSLFSALVGVAIRSIGELLGKLGFFSRLTTALVGVSWSVASLFVIPVLIRDRNRYSPVTFLRSSASLIKKTWGEGLMGIIGIYGAGMLVFLIANAVGIAAFIAALSLELDFFVAAGLLCLCSAAGVAVLLLQSAARQVFVCGLYTFAAEGVAPGPFDSRILEHAWRVRDKT